MANDGSLPNNPLYTYIVGSEKTDWAKNSTLTDLLSKAESTNTILSEYVKKKFPELEQKVIDSQNKASNRLDRGLDDVTEAAEKTSDAVRDLESEFKRQKSEAKYEWDRRIGAITNVVKSADPAEATRLIGAGIEKVGGSWGEKIGGALGKSPFARIVGSIVGSVAGSAIAAALSRSLEVSKVFTEMYDTGITFNGSMVEMAKTASETGQTIEQMQTGMTKFSSTAAAIGSTRLAQFGKTLLDATRQGAEFVMTNEQMRDSAYSYLDMQLKSGQSLVISDQQLTIGAKNLLDNLTGLSAITGKSRKEAEAALKAKMMEAKTKAAMQLLSPEDRELLKQRLAQTPAELQDMVRAIFVEEKLGIPALTDEMRKQRIVAADPEKMAQFDKALTDSATTFDQYQAAQVEAFGHFTDTAALFALLGPASAQGMASMVSGFIDLGNAVMSQKALVEEGMARGLSEEQALKEARKKIKPDEATKAIIEVQNTIAQKLAAARSKVDEEMIKSVGFAAEQIKSFGSSLKDLVDKMSGGKSTLTDVEAGLSGLGGAATTAYLGYKGVKKFWPTAPTPPGPPPPPGPIPPGPPTPPPGPIPPRPTPIGSLLGKGVKVLGSTTGLGLLGYASEFAGEKLEESGHERIGAATKIGGRAATGAALGSMIAPGIGTGIGAAAGTAYGLYENWQNLSGKGPTTPVDIEKAEISTCDVCNELELLRSSVDASSTSLYEIWNVNKLQLETFKTFSTQLKDDFPKELNNTLAEAVRNMNVSHERLQTDHAAQLSDVHEKHDSLLDKLKEVYNKLIGSKPETAEPRLTGLNTDDLKTKILDLSKETNLNTKNEIANQLRSTINDRLAKTSEPADAEQLRNLLKELSNISPEIRSAGQNLSNLSRRTMEAIQGQTRSARVFSNLHKNLMSASILSHQRRNRMEKELFTTPVTRGDKTEWTIDDLENRVGELLKVKDENSRADIADQLRTIISDQMKTTTKPIEVEELRDLLGDLSNISPVIDRAGRNISDLAQRSNDMIRGTTDSQKNQAGMLTEQHREMLSKIGSNDNMSEPVVQGIQRTFAEHKNILTGIESTVASSGNTANQRAFSSATANITDLLNRTGPGTTRTEEPEPRVTEPPVNLENTEHIRRTHAYYNSTKSSSENMIEVLREMLGKLEELNQNVVNQTSDLSRNINNIGHIF